MQVSQTQDHVNHAIIGGKESIDFGISSSAEFFGILSSTLYRDQMLAVVREVMCNAWDAHIEAGIQDKPIVITANHDIFMVQDHGKGIHHEDMGPIYGVYGNSTKKNDGTQTGGFGLGCKSPFAYTDHFEVTSCHEGVKTIYRLSKSLVQNGGKPGMVPIASFPTTESGLTVKINLKSNGDQLRFYQLAQRIAFNGEMLAEINGSVHPKLGFDASVRNYHVYRGMTLVDSDPLMITVRYGNVIYPMESCQALNREINEIQEFLRKLSGNRYDGVGYKILFQAPPHSLSVTPSRESLSMQEHTVNTLRKLFTDFLDEKNKVFSTECDNFAENAIEAAVAKSDYHLLLSRESRLPVDRSKLANVPSVLPDFKAMAERYMSVTYPEDLNFRKADRKCRVMMMVEKKLIDRGMAQTWLREIDGVSELEDSWRRDRAEPSPWVARHVIRRMIGKLVDSDMETDRLYVVDSDDRGFTNRNDGVIPAVKVRPRHHFHTISYLRNIVVLSRKKADIHDRARHHDTFKKLGAGTGYLFYHVGMKVNDVEKARTFFAKTGMNVVDMIDRQEWEPEPYTPPVKGTCTPRNKGLVTVSAILNKHNMIDIDLRTSKDAERIEKPEYVIWVSSGRRSEKNCFGFLDGSMSSQFAKLYGKRGGITHSDTQLQSYIKKGALPFKDFLIAEVVDYFTANATEIEAYWANNPKRVQTKVAEGLTYQQRNMLEAVYAIPQLVKYYNTQACLSDISQIYVNLFDYMINHGIGNDKKSLMDLKRKLEAIPVNPNNDALVKKISKCKLLDLLDTNHLRYHTFGGKQLDKVVEIITSILDS